eukprot:scaffold92660_cov23-Tisochrysis_lutea.AAC.1
MHLQRALDEELASKMVCPVRQHKELCSARLMRDLDSGPVPGSPVPGIPLYQVLPPDGWFRDGTRPVQ